MNSGDAAERAVLAIFILGVFSFLVYAAIESYRQHRDRQAELTKKLDGPATKISDWRTGWRCPTCRKWTGYSLETLGSVVCKVCGSSASDYERVKYRALLRLDESGYYQFDRAIDMSGVVMRSGECDYCGKKPCGCGATHNWLEVLEEVEA